MRITTVIMMIFALMLSTTPAFAGDTDPNGTQLRAIVDDYLKTAPPGDKDAEVIRAAEGANGGMDGAAAAIVCTLEMLTGVGLAIWSDRMAKDNCGSTDLKNPYHYCCEYSRLIDHWHWTPDDIKKHSFFKDTCTR